VARIPLLDRFRRPRTAGEADPAVEYDGGGPPAPRLRRLAPSPGALRRERRAIIKAREERIRDLGGLVLEMYRHDHFREDLLNEQCQDVVGLELRLQELDSMLEAATTARRAPAARCECGAPTVWGSHFCANCGRPVGAMPVVACSACGHPLPADASFCASCGSAAELSTPDGPTEGQASDYDVEEPAEAEDRDADDAAEATVIRTAHAQDRWEP
jgi:hypothetical protein